MSFSFKGLRIAAKPSIILGIIDMSKIDISIPNVITVLKNLRDPVFEIDFGIEEDCPEVFNSELTVCPVVYLLVRRNGKFFEWLVVY